MNDVFFQLTAVVALAAALGMLARWLKQPTILGYILTGVIVGPLGFLHLDSLESLDAFAQIGITFLLFLVGMEMRLEDLKRVGKTALLTGLGQIVFTSVFGFALARLLGFASLSALYIAVALTFSSTIIVVKLLSEKHSLESLHGKIVVGFLLVQDVVALGFLILLSSLPEGAAPALASLPWAHILTAFGKGALLFAGAILAGRYAMPKLLQSVGRSQEVLFLVSLAWGLSLAALAAQIGLSVELGAFAAGIAMAGSFERHQISSRIKSLRDFFIVIFFIVLGSRMAISELGTIVKPALALSAYVLIGNPLIMLVIMGLLGYRSRVSFLASVTVAQISEFSLILVALGATLGHVGPREASLVTMVGIITIALSSYLILYSEQLYRLLRRPLRVFEFRHRRAKEEGPAMPADHIVLIGCHRMGHNILESLRETGQEFLVVDFNPDVVSSLARRGIPTLYGDISDPEIVEQAGLDAARLVISTVPDFRDSVELLRHLHARNPRARTVMTAENEYEAVDLYEAGADYVLLPHFIGGLQLARTIQEDASLESLRAMRERDIALITGTI